jgi:hypothetical protein
VFGARLLITSLGAPAGPAVEFLDYLAPATGRPTPLDTQANDLWSWQIRMETTDLVALEKTLRQAGAAFVSPGIVKMPADDLALGRALMVRSPDGHALLLIERSQ